MPVNIPLVPQAQAYLLRPLVISDLACRVGPSRA
jgi:hypothetical protein